MTLRVAVTGAGGRMGRAVAQAVLSDVNATLVSVCARQSSDLVGQSVASVLGTDIADLRIGGALAQNRGHRINRHDTADDEGHGQKADKGHQKRHSRIADLAQNREQGRAGEGR